MPQITDLINRKYEQPCLRHDMKDWKVFSVVGADARDFLDRMLSSVVPTGSGQCGLSACCTVDGRVQGVILLFHLQGEIAYLAPSDTGVKVADHLRRYILRSDVVITELADSPIGISGPDAASWLTGQVGSIPDQEWHSVVSTGGGVVIAVPGAIPRFFIVGEHALPLDLLPVAEDETLWSLLDVEAAIPWLTGASAGKHLPQMLNLHQLGALDFNKGCYPGQEVVIRLQHRGKLKRHLCRVVMEDMTESSLKDMQAGETILDTEDQVVGEIISPRVHGAALAVVVDTAWQQSATLRHNGQPANITVVDGTEAQAP